MLPAPPGYLAVRGRILSIPGTEYVVITPDWGTGDQEHGADVAQTQDTNSNSVVKLGNEDGKDQQKQDTTHRQSTSSDVNVDDVDLAGSSSAKEQKSTDTLPLLTKPSRGRPPKGRSKSPCQCPNCKVCQIQTGDFVYRSS